MKERISIGRKCKKCGKTKDLSEFVFEKRCKHDRGWSCQKCADQYQKNWYEKNKARILVKAKEYRSRDENKEKRRKYIADNREVISLKSKEWRAKRDDLKIEAKRNNDKNYYKNNKEKIQQYRELNRHELNAKSRKYYEEHKDCLNEKNREYYWINKEHILQRLKIS